MLNRLCFVLCAGWALIMLTGFALAGNPPANRDLAFLFGPFFVWFGLRAAARYVASGSAMGRRP